MDAAHPHKEGRAPAGHVLSKKKTSGPRGPGRRLDESRAKALAACFDAEVKVHRYRQRRDMAEVLPLLGKKIGKATISKYGDKRTGAAGATQQLFPSGGPVCVPSCESNRSNGLPTILLFTFETVTCNTTFSTRFRM